MRVLRIVAVAGSIACLVASCHYRRTQLVLRVDTDMSQGRGADLTTIRVTIRSADAPTADAGVLLLREVEVGVGEGRTALPADLVGVSPRGGDPSREVEVTVSALQAGAVLFTRRAVASFERDETGLLEVFLPARCVDAANQRCAPGEECGRTGCEPQRRAAPLPRYVLRSPAGDAQATDAP